MADRIPEFASESPIGRRPENHSRGNIAALFPGQGAFDQTALLAAYKCHPQVAEVFDAVAAALQNEVGRSLTETMFSAQPIGLRQLSAESPYTGQLAIYASDVAAFQILAENGLSPDVLMGHSFGEIPALVCAGGFSVADGALLVWHRTRVLEEFAKDIGYMAALGANADRVNRLVDVIGERALVVAADNYKEQTVVSGPAPAMDVLHRVAEPLGISFRRLDAAYPFHSPLLETASAKFAAEARTIPRRRLELPVYSPILERYYEPDEDLADRLAEQLIRPVRFRPAVQRLQAEGVRAFVECGARGALARLAARNLDSEDLLFLCCLPAANNGADPATEALTALRRSGYLPAAPRDCNSVEEPSPGGKTDEFSMFWADYGPWILNQVRTAFDQFSAEHGSALPAGRPADPDWSSEEFTETADPPQTRRALTRDQLAGELRTMFAAALEYPEDVFTDEALLEDELGVDSLKQGEMLARVAERYGFQATDSDVQQGGYKTMGEVVDLVYAELSK
jgi:acyl transferase domain-containing protein